VKSPSVLTAAEGADGHGDGDDVLACNVAVVNRRRCEQTGTQQRRAVPVLTAHPTNVTVTATSEAEEQDEQDNKNYKPSGDSSSSSNTLLAK